MLFIIFLPTISKFKEINPILFSFFKIGAILKLMPGTEKKKKFPIYFYNANKMSITKSCKDSTKERKLEITFTLYVTDGKILNEILANTIQ